MGMCDGVGSVVVVFHVKVVHVVVVVVIVVAVVFVLPGATVRM